MTRSARLQWLVVTAFATAALATIATSAGSSWLVTHITGLLVMLAELLREGVFYPREATLELVYSTYYQPLAFAPIALLPGHGLELVRGMRWLIGCETLALLGTMVALVRSLGASWGTATWPALWALCTMPCLFALVGMRDDPRAAWFAMAGLLALARRGRFAPELAGLWLALAFFTKITAPAAPGLAALVLAVRAGRPILVRFAFATTACVAVPFAILQWACGADLLGIVLRLGVFEPAFVPRSLLGAALRMGHDLGLLDLGSWSVMPLAALSLALLALRLYKLRIDACDVLVAATWLKTLMVYRHPGTDLNHLLDLVLALAIHVTIRSKAWLTSGRGLLVLAGLYALGRPHEFILSGRRLPPLEATSAAGVSLALAAAPASGPTLAEDPLVAILADLRPRVPDPSTADAILRRHPQIGARWFGPKTQAGALQRIVLLRDPFATGAEPDAAQWYGVVAYGKDFVAELRAHWKIVISSDAACVLERR